MKIKFISTTASIALFAFLFSCNTVDIMQDEPKQGKSEIISVEAYNPTLDLDHPFKNFPKFEVVNGCLKFQTREDFLSIYELLSKMTEKELLAWSKNYGYISLLNSYEKSDSIFMSTFVPNRDYEPGENVIDKSERILNTSLSTLYNSDGIVVVQNFILKMRGLYVYVIENYEMVNIIEKASDVRTLDNIPHYRHTAPTASMLTNEITTRNMMLNGNYSRTPVIQVSTSRREFVEFYDEVTYVLPSNGYAPAVIDARFYMKGQAQTKSLGIWWPNFNDEIWDGSVNVNNYGNLHNLCFFGHDVVTISSSRLIIADIGVTSNVTFEVQKNKNHPRVSYTNNYFYIIH